MRIAISLATLLLLAGAGSADADWFSNTKKLPKPIDTPIVRPKVQETHKVGKKQRHPPGYIAQLDVQIETARA
jgi:hypothetical protein